MSKTSAGSTKEPVTDGAAAAAEEKLDPKDSSGVGVPSPVVKKRNEPELAEKPVAQPASGAVPTPAIAIPQVTADSRSTIPENTSTPTADRIPSEKELPKAESLNRKLWTPAIGGTIFLSIVSSALWESAVKPGLSHFGRFMLNALTLGSERIRDEAYHSAAMDPTGVPSLQGLENTTFFMILLNIFLLGMVLALRAVVQVLEPSSQDDNGATPKTTTKKKPTSRSILKSKLFIVIIGCWLVFGVITHGISFVKTNQSVLIWRVFQTNVTILAPALKSHEEKNFRARFASMKTRADFMALNKDMHEIANQNGITLSDIETW